MDKFNWAVILKPSDHSFTNLIVSSDPFSQNKLFCTSSPIKWSKETYDRCSNEQISEKLESMMQTPNVIGNAIFKSNKRY
jgi:hypothetical protein